MAAFRVQANPCVLYCLQGSCQVLTCYVAFVWELVLLLLHLNIAPSFCTSSVWWKGSFLVISSEFKITSVLRYQFLFLDFTSFLLWLHWISLVFGCVCVHFNFRYFLGLVSFISFYFPEFLNVVVLLYLFFLADLECSVCLTSPSITDVRSSVLSGLLLMLSAVVHYSLSL